MPFGVHLELSGLPDNAELSSLCIAPYCIVIALCSVSVLITVAIAVDRLTSLAQPLRYKNIITHSSVEKYIAVFWLYAIAVGLSPLIYAQITGLTHSHRYMLSSLLSFITEEYDNLPVVIYNINFTPTLRRLNFIFIEETFSSHQVRMFMMCLQFVGSRENKKISFVNDIAMFRERILHGIIHLNKNFLAKVKWKSKHREM